MNTDHIAVPARRLRVPRHRGTTAHLCSAYPFLAEPGLGARGVYIGTNVLTGGGGFAYDPFTAYADGVLTNPNVIVAGEVGMGKSTAVKCFVHRSVGMFGRWVAIADPKGEYLPLAEALGLTVLELHPGGSTRLNPLDPGPHSSGMAADETARRQAELVAALIGEVLHRDLDPIEDALLGWSLTHLAQNPRVGVATLGDVVAVMRTPPDEVASRATMTRDELTRAASPAIYALGKLIDRSLRGMFDGPTNVRLDPDGPGLVVDLSAVFQDRDALSLVLLAVTAWLQTAITQPRGPRRLQILDEAWALFGNERTARYLQSCWKLSRAYGVANVAVIHRLSDLRAQADDGTSTAKIAVGLLADTQTRILFRQATDQAPEARDLLGLTSVEADLLTRLTRGRALWKVAGRTAVVQHVVARGEVALSDTNARMITDTPPLPATFTDLDAAGDGGSSLEMGNVR
jgi:hypothetical protein